MSKADIKVMEKYRDGYTLYSLTLRGRGEYSDKRGDRQKTWEQGRTIQGTVLKTLEAAYPGTNHGYIGCVRDNQGFISLTGVYCVRGQGWTNPERVKGFLRACQEDLKSVLRGFKLVSITIGDRNSYENLYRGPFEMYYAERPMETETLDHIQEWEAPARFGRQLIIRDRTGRFCIRRDDGSDYVLFDGQKPVYQSAFLNSCYRAARERR